MPEPDFAAQTDEPVGRRERNAWVQKRAEEFREQGATWFRATINEANSALVLVEGWKVRPDPEPPPRFFEDAR